MTAQRYFLQQSDVQKILAAADAHAAKNNWAVTIAVMDEGGHLLGLIRRDGCPAMSIYVAQEKARAAALGCQESKAFEDIINAGRISVLGAAPMLHGMLEGGVNIVVGGQTIGAVGVSGVESKRDAEIARAGIAGLEAQEKP